MLLAGASGTTSFDLATGNVLKVFKHCELQPGSLVGCHAGVLAGQLNKPVIHHYSGKETVAKKLVSPEKFACLETNKEGTLLAAGTYTGRLLLWDLHSGALLSSCDGHFQAITHISFAETGALVTAGKDARILVWRIQDLVAQSDSSEPQAVHVLASHSLPITGLQVGLGNILEARIFSCSEDSTICIHQLHNGRLLQTLMLPEPLTSLVVDPAERRLYTGTKLGVRVIDMYLANSQNKLESRYAQGPLSDCHNSAIYPGEAVTALCLTDDATHVIVGDANGGINAWDVGTSQLMRAFRAQKGAVTDLKIVGDSTGDLPMLQKVVEPVDDVILACIETPEVSQPDYDACVAAVFANAPQVAAVSDFGTSEELEKLRTTAKQYEQLKQMYDDLWARHVKK